MKLCFKCIDRIKASSKLDVKCADPFSRGDHKCNDFVTITTNTHKQFFNNKDKLPLGSALCGSCRVRLLKYQNQLLVSLDLCSNPFNLEAHKIASNHRVITDYMAKKYEQNVNLSVGEKLCNNCRTKLYRGSQQVVTRDRSRSR